jgi:hypothetical protein
MERLMKRKEEREAQQAVSEHFDDEDVVVFDNVDVIFRNSEKRERRNKQRKRKRKISHHRTMQGLVEIVILNQFRVVMMIERLK